MMNGTKQNEQVYSKERTCFLLFGTHMWCPGNTTYVERSWDTYVGRKKDEAFLQMLRPHVRNAPFS